MKLQKGCEPTNQHLSSQAREWPKEDRKAIADLFALLLEMEIEQQNNVTKEYADEDAHK